MELEPKLEQSDQTSTGTDSAIAAGNQHSPNMSDTKLDAERGAISPPQEEQLPVRAVTGFKWFLFLSSTLTSMFLYALDNTIVADIVPAIVNDFNGIANLPWLSVGFMIGGVAMVMPFGKLYGLYNAKWLYVGSNVIFLAASALCGGAPNMSAEIVGRVFAGAGGNGMYLGIMTLISVNTTNAERPTYLSLTGLIWGIGTVLGPVVGGGFELYTWRWAFYINLLFGAILMPLYVFILPSFDPAPGLTFLERAAMFDGLGAILSVGGFTSLVMGINFGGASYAWNSGQIIALFVVSGVLWITFAVQQSLSIFTTPRNRVFPVHLIKRKEPVLLFMALSSAGAAIYITLYYIPIYFQFTRGDTAIQAAVRLLPFVFILSALVMANGFLMSRWGYYTPWYFGGSILSLIGSVLMSKIDVNTSTSAIYGYEVLIAFGAGSFVQAGFAVIQTIVSPADMSYGITLMMTAQLCGLSLGLSIAGAVFLNVAQNQLIILLPNVPLDTLRQAISGTSGTFFNSLTPDVRAQSLDIVVSSLRTTFIGAYAASALALLCSIFMNHKRAYLPVGQPG